MSSPSRNTGVLSTHSTSEWSFLCWCCYFKLSQSCLPFFFHFNDLVSLLLPGSLAASWVPHRIPLPHFRSPPCFPCFFLTSHQIYSWISTDHGLPRVPFGNFFNCKIFLSLCSFRSHDILGCKSVSLAIYQVRVLVILGVNFTGAV